MKTFTSPFNSAKNKTAHAPVNLLRIDWPAVNGNSAKTICLCDRGSGGSYSAAGQNWIPLVSDWGDLSRNVDETMLTTNSDADLRILILNSPVDWGDGVPKSFSELSLAYPPEAAITAKVYQWFEGEGLGSGDLVELFTASINPVEFDEDIAELDLVAISGALGERMIGNALSLGDYSNAPSGAVGKIKPIVIGLVEGAPGILVRTAPETELTDSVLPGDSTIPVKDTSLFPANGQIEIDNDVIIYSGKSVNSFAGCQSLGDNLHSSGIAQSHSGGAKAVQSISDYRYLFSDPAYPIKSINNVQVGGQPADSVDYSIDLDRCEVRFSSRPKILKSAYTEYLQLEFDAVADGNSAGGAGNASNPSAVTSNATINQISPSLRLKLTKTLANRGPIKKVYVGVEHYEEEKLPNDFVRVSIASIGILGNLAKPNSNDKITVGGQTNIGHGHLESIGGVVDISHTQGHNISAQTNISHPHTENINASLNDPTHYHQVNTDGERTELQATTTPVGKFDAVAGKIFSFPSYGGATLKAEYVLGISLTGTWNAAPNSTGGSVYLNNVEVARVTFDGKPPTYTNQITISGATPSTATFSASGFNYVEVSITSLTRRLVFTGSSTSTPITTGAAVTKSGTVNPLANTNKAASIDGGVNAVPAGTEKSLGRSGGIDPLSASSALSNVTQEKVSRAVIEYFDITPHVPGWSWFTNQEVRVEYVGSSDGRSSYIVHTFFDIEYTNPQYETTDAVTADVEGIKDVAGSITGTAGALITRPDHVFKWSLFNSILGLGSGDIDSDSFDSAGSAFAAAFPGGYKLAGIIDSQKSFKNLWAVWEKESRSYLYWTNTGKTKLLYRVLNDVTGLSSVKAITPAMIRADAGTGKSSIKAKRTLASNLVNAIDLKYSRDWATSDYGDIMSVSNINSKNIYGLKQKPELFSFDWTRSADQAADIAAFYLKELSVPMTIVEMEVFLDNLEIEKGDIIDITHSFNNMSARKALVLEANHHLGSGNAGKMDSMTLIARLFVVDFLAMTFNDSITAQDAISQVLVDVTFGESLTAVENLLITANQVLTDSVSVSDELLSSVSLILGDSISVSDNLLVDAELILSDTITAVENLLQTGVGYGLDLYGTGPYGGMISLSDIYVTFQDSITAVDALELSVSLTLSDSVAANDNDDLKLTFNDVVVANDALFYPNEGYGAQWYGTSGYGGIQHVA